MDLFEELKYSNNPGIYSLLNEKNKTGFIFESSNIATDLIRKINSNKFNSGYSFELLEIVTDHSPLGKIKRLIKCNYYIAKYSNNGYNIISKSINFKVRIDTLQDFRDSTNHHILFYVKIVSRRFRDVTVGVFGTYGEVEEFIARYYNNGVEDLVFSQNQLTREYLKK